MPFAHIIVHFEIPKESCFMLLVYLTVNLHSRLEMCDGLYVFALNEFVSFSIDRKKNESTCP